MSAKDLRPRKLGDMLETIQDQGVCKDIILTWLAFTPLWLLFNIHCMALADTVSSSDTPLSQSVDSFKLVTIFALHGDPESSHYHPSILSPFVRESFIFLCFHSASPRTPPSSPQL
ncbi:hypothetical protein TREES_T100002908 [Tupaia chinensis]|uniref:Uncharacterized protein n=1 Tax=Tupaia chinensis TaxID=246437 RepID=L9KUL0_TUPCH|nr:hypothetical protein TREES_T100002908 [Tupaia chinensis]